MMNSSEDWWKTGIIYQIYPRSFQDSNGDGIGDLAGIEARLDYLETLGVDAIWISPIYPSPMVDFGYDITDHCGIDPIFGDFAAFDSLIAAVHARGIKLILDFVPCHTSNQHPWFIDSRAGVDHPKRDWYIWRDPGADGGPPNNWLSEFGGSAWTLDPATGQYYHHAHLTEQPDLNWRNPEVVEAMLDVLRFWFGRGVDGFRIDAVDQLVKDAAFRDNPPNPDWYEGMPATARFLRTRQKDQPELHPLAERMRAVADEFGGRVLCAEAYLPFDRMAAYYGRDLGGFHMPYNFHLIGAQWEAETIAGLIRDYEASLPSGAWPNWVMGNHDRARIASRLGAAQARVAAMLMLTLRGTPTLYQGDELGMESVPIPPEQVVDPWEKNMPGQGLGRDPVRTPIPWEIGAGAGFTTGEPWLPIDARAALIAENQSNEPDSMLRLYRDLIALRRTEPSLLLGDYREVTYDGPVLRFTRHAPGARAVTVLLNLSDKPQDLCDLGPVLLSTLERGNPETDLLRPAEGLVAVAVTD